jgi:hypothetical protein
MAWLLCDEEIGGLGLIDLEENYEEKGCFAIGIATQFLSCIRHF